MHLQHLRRDAGGKHRQMAGVEIGEPRVGALVRHMHDVGQAGELLEQFSAQMRRCADARGTVGQLARIGLRIGNQFLQRVHRQRCVHHETRYRDRGDGDRREILHGVVGRRAHDHRTDDQLAGGAGQERIAVRLRARDLSRGDDAAAAALVLDDHVAELRLDLLGPQAGDHVHHAARRTRNDEADRLIRIFALCGCGERSESGERQR